MSDQYSTGVYVKGDSEKVANTTARAVALVFEGYRLKETVPADDTSYRDLQAQAKELGIKANQPEAALREAIAAASLPGPDTIVEPDTTTED
jgi:hypothetical protein